MILETKKGNQDRIGRFLPNSSTEVKLRVDDKDNDEVLF